MTESEADRDVVRAAALERLSRRWWVFLCCGILVGAEAVIRAYTRSPYTVEFSVGWLIGFLFTYVVLMGGSFFLAGVLFGRRRRAISSEAATRTSDGGARNPRPDRAQ